MAGLLETLKKKKDELVAGLSNAGKKAQSNYKAATGNDLNAKNVVKQLASDFTGFLTAGNVGSKNVPTYRMADTALQSGRSLGQALENNGHKQAGQLVRDTTSLISGASRLTPGEIAGNLGLGDSNSRIKGTERERTLQDVGQTAYGLALTAPLAGGSGVLGKAAAIGKNVAFGSGLGATIGGVTAAASGEPVLQAVKEGALSGAKNSYMLPVTNAITGKLIGTASKALPVLKNLSPEAMRAAATQTGKLAHAGQYGAAAQNALKVIGTGALREGLNSPLETAAFTLDDKSRLNTNKTFSQQYKDRFLGDLAGNVIFGGASTIPGQAIQGVKGALDFNQNYKNGFVQNVDGSKRTVQQYELKKALENGATEPVNFGRLSDGKFAQINEIRVRNGLEPIQSQDLLVHPNVLKKLQEKRIDVGKMTPDQVADVAYSALYNNDSRVLPSRYPQIQTLAKFNSDGKTANTAYIGEHDNSGSVKSIYIKDAQNINNETMDGAALPSMNPSKVGNAATSNISGTHSSVNTPIIAQNAVKSNDDGYFDALSKQVDVENGGQKVSPVESNQAGTDFDRQIQDNLDFYSKQTTNKTAKVNKEVKGAINPLNNLSDVDRQAFDNWRSRSISSNLEADNLAKMVDSALGNPDAETAWKITQYMQDPTPQTAAALGLENPQQYQGAIENMRKMYTELYNTVVDQTGKETGWIDNYVPQMWQESQEQIEQIARSAGIKPSWMNQRIIPDYQTGVQLGLTPKYTHPGQLLAEYFTKSQKALANNELVNDLLYRGVIENYNSGKNWSMINSDTIQSGGKKLYAPKPVATALNNIFGEGSKGSDFLDFTQNLNRRMQNFVLSGGIPATPFNSFTLGQTIKEVTGGNFTAVRSLARSFSNKASEQFITEHQPSIKLMAKNGINVDSGHNYKTEFENALGGKQGILSKLGAGFDKLFEEPTFKRFMPMKNIEYFETIYNGALKNGQTQEVAAKTAADMTKSWMGLIDNYARNKKGQQAINSVFFAPAYREGMLNFWTNLAKAVPHITAPENRQFLKFAVGTAITYGLYNAVNKALTGHYMWENKTGKKLSVEIPEGEAAGGETGRSLFMGILPSVATMPRNAFEIGAAMLGGDGETVKQKLGSYFSMPIKLGSELLANQDFFGNPIRDTESSPLDQASQVAGYVAGDYTHPFIGAGVDLAMGRRNLLESGLKVAETPLYGSRSTDTAGLTKKEYETYQNINKQGGNAKNYALDAAELKRQKEAIKNGVDPNASWWDSLWGNNQVEQFVPSDNANLRATQKTVIKDKIKQMDMGVTPEELSFAYLYDVEQMPTSNRYETAQRSSKLYGMYDDIIEDEYLSPDQKSYLTEQVRNDLGQSEQAMDYYLKASAANNNLKTMVVYDDLDAAAINNDTPEGHEQLMSYLVDGRMMINGKILAADGVVDNLYYDGLISNAERKWLKNLDWDELKGDWKSYGGSSSGGSRSSSSKKSASAKAASKLATAMRNQNITSPAVPTIKIAAAPQFDPVNFGTIKIADTAPNVNLDAPKVDSEALIKIAQG